MGAVLRRLRPHAVARGMSLGRVDKRRPGSPRAVPAGETDMPDTSPSGPYVGYCALY